MKITPEQLKAIKEAWEAIKKVIMNVIRVIRKAWLECRLWLLKTPEGRKILMKVVTNNNWRKMHGLPMIRRARSNI